MAVYMAGALLVRAERADWCNLVPNVGHVSTVQLRVNESNPRLVQFHQQPDPDVPIQRSGQLSECELRP